MPKGDDEAEVDPLIGKWFWLKVEDEDLWCLSQVKKHWQGQVFLERSRAPKEVTRGLQITDEEFKKRTLPATEDDADLSEVLKFEDLVQLPDPNDMSMLHVLRARYEKDSIFTWIGPVLLALNPYKAVDICSSESLDNMTKIHSDELPPHIYTLSKTAYDGLIQEGNAQSILISGESGAGKTETAKLAIRSIALQSKSSPAVAERALETGLLLEAFGNSRTIYNNNSSRFGKWTEINFDDAGKMGACTIKTFLLEQSRVVAPPPGERNYHVFYHLLAGADAPTRATYSLKPTNKDYAYTAGEARSDGIDDVALWADVQRQFGMIGLNAAMQEAVLSLLVGVLNLGNIKFQPKAGGGDDNPLEPKERSILDEVAKRLQVDPDGLALALTTRKMMVAGSEVVKQLSDEDATDTRDTLARTVYMVMFDHLVGKINLSLATDEEPDEERYIGILDVFGFENFRINLLEQLCINFANERLQQLFMDCLIKRETAEYKREGIECAHIEYPDNGLQIELIDAKKAGVFALLDDECNQPKASDEKYVSRMNDAFPKHKIYAKQGVGRDLIGPELGKELAAKQFTINHYAEKVCYTANKWLEKNRGQLKKDLADLLAASGSYLLQQAYPAEQEADKKPPTVTATFRASMRELSATMLRTNQNFARCVKPNGKKIKDAMSGEFTARQLRYLGVHAVIAVNKVGYPFKFKHAEFVAKYRCIAFDQPELIDESKHDAKAICDNLLKVGGGELLAGWLKDFLLQKGATKLFMRPAIIDTIEKPRKAARTKACIKVQAYWKRAIAYKVVKFVRLHVAKAKPVMVCLGSTESGERKLRKAAAIREHLAEAEYKMEELNNVWKTPLDPKLAMVVRRCAEQKKEFEAEWRSQDKCLATEMEAAEKVKGVIAEEAGLSKEAFLKLKAAHAEAEAAFVTRLTIELSEALESFTKTLEERFAAVIKQWEEDAKRAEAERKAARKKKVAEAEAIFLGETPYPEPDDGKPPLKATTFTAVLRNGINSGASTKGKAKARHKGFHATMGIAIDENNKVVELTKGTALTDGLLSPGDVVLLVNGERLHGDKATEAMESRAAEQYTLTLARPAEAPDAPKRLPPGDHSGWMTIVRAKQTGKGMKGLHPSRKVWACISGHTLSLFEDQSHKGGGSSVEFRLTLAGAVAKAFTNKLKKGSNKGVGATPRGELQGPLNSDTVNPELSGGGKSSRSHVIELVADLFDAGLVPFRVELPRGVVDYELICAVDNDKIYDAWEKAIVVGAELAPFSGYLVKKKGRHHPKGLTAMMGGWDKRWFEVLQPTGDEDATITYYESEDHYKTRVVKGSVNIDKHASVESTTQFESKGHPYALALTTISDGKPDMPVVTYVAAANFIELEKWKGAFNRAMRSFHRASGGVVMVLSKEEKKLATQPVEKLKSTLKYMGVSFDEKTTDPTRLAFLIMRGKEAREAERLAKVEAEKAGKGPKFKAKKRQEGAKSALMKKIRREQENLLKRGVEELLQLLDFMDVEVPPECADKPEVLANLIINQRYFSQVSKHIEPWVKNWAKRAKARLRERKMQEEVELS